MMANLEQDDCYLKLTDNEVTNMLVVVSRWYGSKIGPRMFTYINDAGVSTVKNMHVTDIL